MPRCRPEPLERFAADFFGALGAARDVATEAARHLVRANLSGHDSHGVIRIPQYGSQAQSGELRPGERPVISRETGATALIDARRSVGLYSTRFALDWAMAHARQFGIAAAAIRHSSHIGRVGEYTEEAAGRGLIAIVTVGAAGPGVGGMVLYGGRGRFLGANPWSIGIPVSSGAPVVFDGSTSTIAEGKVRVARAKGASLPEDCIIDAAGNPSVNPEDFYAGGALVPLGGRVAGHKGFGLAITSALLSALGMISDPEPTFIGASTVATVSDPRGRIAGVFVIVIDPALFGDPAQYRALTSETVAAARRMPPAKDSEILLPGEIEVRTREQRSREGIALPEATWRDLEAVARKLGITMPEVME